MALLLFPILLCGWSYLPSSSIGSKSFSVEAVPCQSSRCYWSPPSQTELAGLHGLSHAGNADVHRVSRKKLNQLARATTGNRRNRGIKLAHWNAGSAHLYNKMDELEQVVADLHPHDLGVSEASFKFEHFLDDVHIIHLLYK
jgi:hypothetical protein